MGALLALLIWHVDRHRATQQRLVVLQQDERHQAQQREIASKFGTHEVRTRLAIARGFVELMQSATDDPGMRKDAELVLEELDKASVLVTNLLTLVRFGTPTATVPVDVESLVESVKNRWVAAADREWSCDSFSGFIEGDPERLEAALDCLIENAVKFTQVGDSISITGRLDGLEMTISVRDSGAGIPEQDLDRIFDVFQTSSSAGDLAGSGLGLPIVRAIVEARHGSLTVESAVGVGTCFTLRVPVPYGVTGPDPTSSFPASRQDPMVASLPLSS
jgi:signal transduction histidine kinase